MTTEIQWPDGKYYSCDDSAEVLTHEDPWSAIEDFLQGFIDHLMTVEALEEAIRNAPVQVTAYVPMEVGDAQIRMWAESLTETLAEMFGEEHANPDDDVGDWLGPDAGKVMLDAVTKIVRSSKVWSCRSTGSLDLDGEQVLALARKECPEWFVDRTK